MTDLTTGVQSVDEEAVPGASRLLVASLLALGVGLATNALLGPLALDVIRYRFTDSLVHQGVGLDFVSLVVVAPLACVSALHTLRGRASGPALALGIGAYSAYMAIQYVVGPEYLALPGNNERFFLLHVGLLVLGLSSAGTAWSAAEERMLPPESARARRRWGGLLLALGVVLLLRYGPAIVTLVAGDPTIPEYRENPTSFLLIATLDLGVFLPAIAATGVALWGGGTEARKALHLVLGWFALVGLAVAAMSVTMWMHGDSAASEGRVAAFVGAGLVLAAIYLRLVWPLFGRPGDPGDEDASSAGGAR